MNYKELKNTWMEEEQHAFQGWDFSHLQSRWQHGPLIWDYKSIVMEHLHPADRLLDMGTGGGEFLLSLAHSYENTSVTEAWQPNIQLCMEKLVPLGIQVYPVQEDAHLPIADDSFDIVINRHESYDLHEVRRVLKPRGMFITQQVGGENCITLEKRVNLEIPLRQAFSVVTELPKFHDCGFSVNFSNECFPQLKFFDVGAIVFWAKIIEWSFPGFSVERNYDRLCTLQDDIIPHVYWAIEDATYFDIVSTVHLKEYALVLTISEQCIPQYAQLGMKAYFVPHTIDPDMHKPVDNPDPQYLSDLVVTANSFRAGSPENIFRKESFNFMARPLILGGYDIKVHGSHWEPEKLGLPKSNFMGYSALSYVGHIYSGTKIVVGIQRNYDGHVCFRTFEALSYGRLLISPYTPVQEEFFTHEKHLIYAHNEEEAKQYVDYYLTHPAQREKIALAGQEEVHKNHSCAVRAQQAVAAMKASGII